MDSGVSVTNEDIAEVFGRTAEVGEKVEEIVKLRISCNSTATELAGRIGNERVYKDSNEPALFKEPMLGRGHEMVCELTRTTVSNENTLKHFCNLIWQYLHDVSNFPGEVWSDSKIKDCMMMISIFRTFSSHSALRRPHQIETEDQMREAIAEYLEDWIGKPILKATLPPSDFFEVQTRMLDRIIEMLVYLDRNLEDILSQS